MNKITKELRKAGIYCIVNIVNNKKYIGSSKNLYGRLQKHFSLLRHNKHQNNYLQSSWDKYGESVFDYYIVELSEEINLESREQFYIDNLTPEYNITKIVERNILSKESRAKQSYTRKIKIASGEIIVFEKIKNCAEYFVVSDSVIGVLLRSPNRIYKKTYKVCLKTVV